MPEGSPVTPTPAFQATISAAGARVRGVVRGISHRPVALLCLTLAVGVLVRLYRFDAPILDQHAFRQTQTASTVWLWNRDGFDFLDYHVPMFGGGNWVLELPVYQTIVWVLQVPLGGIEPAARIVSICSYVAAATLLYLISARWFGSRAAALFGAVVFTFLPVTVFFFRAVLIDTLFIATTLLAVYAAMRLADRFTWSWFAVLSVALVVSALGKATLVLAIGLAIGVLAIRVVLDHRNGRAVTWALVGLGALTAVLSFTWTRHADALNLASGALTFSDGRSWYFGSTFTDTALYHAVGQRFLDNFGPIGLLLVGIGLAAIPSLPTPYRPEIVATLVGAFLSVGIFANLNRVHDYYQLAYYVPLSMLAGLGLLTVYRLGAVAGPPVGRQVVGGLLVALVGMWSLSLWNGYYAPSAVNLAQASQGDELRAHTPDTRLVIIQENADKNEPMLWYEARRTGWRVPTSDALQAQSLVRDHPDVGAIVFLNSGNPEPEFVPELARIRGYTKTYASPGMTVYRRPGA